nr:alpha/beta hydrolase [Lelliottia sp. WAP21]
MIHLSFLFTGCVSTDPLSTANALAARSGLISENLQTERYPVATWSRFTPPVKAIHVYIEGDGFAWKSRTQPSDNPTPRNPTGLSLAAADASSSVLYLARPCQFILPLPTHCTVNEWTTDRFSPEALGAMNEALDQIVSRYPGVKLDLIGYSGGGNIAALLAMRRTDVRSLRTVAGNLDVTWVNALHQVTPMPHALNAIDTASALRALPQIHYSGDQDEVVPTLVARRFQQAVGGHCTQVKVVHGMGHGSDWGAKWAELSEESGGRLTFGC